MEQREHIRTDVSGMKVYIVDCAGLCNGILENMSCFGLCISDIPRDLQPDSGKIDAVVYGKGYNFKLQLEQKWQTGGGERRTIGATIEDVPWDWAELSLLQELKLRRPEGSVSYTRGISGIKDLSPTRKFDFSSN